jgi:hypothetical protein
VWPVPAHYEGYIEQFLRAFGDAGHVPQAPNFDSDDEDNAASPPPKPKRRKTNKPKKAPASKAAPKHASNAFAMTPLDDDEPLEVPTLAARTPLATRTPAEIQASIKRTGKVLRECHERSQKAKKEEAKRLERSGGFAPDDDAEERNSDESE